jgi:hypothetical protein
VDEEVRQTLLWLAEQIHGASVSRPTGTTTTSTVWVTDRPFSACSTCGHARGDHLTDEDREYWPCQFPKSGGAPVRLCSCLDYQPPDTEP